MVIEAVTPSPTPAPTIAPPAVETVTPVPVVEDEDDGDIGELEIIEE